MPGKERKRKVHRPEFKARVGLKAWRGLKTIHEISQEVFNRDPAGEPRDRPAPLKAILDSGKLRLELHPHDHTGWQAIQVKLLRPEPCNPAEKSIKLL